MSSSRGKNLKRRELLQKVYALGRVMSTQTVFLHQAIAQSVGLNATDTKCVDLILRNDPPQVTSGWLAEKTGLTTGAITHIVDRLEKAGYIERDRDANDRRKVLLRVRMENLAKLAPRYEQIGEAYMEIIEEYSNAQLQLICEYLEKVSAVSERELTKLIAANAQGAEP
jgi:DNA-binding MarR family transcriptional regulator